MRADFSHLDRWRVIKGTLATLLGEKAGAFEIPFRGRILTVIATSGQHYIPKWEHVSVSLKNRCPNWDEMCFIKALFWDDTETAIQYHPKTSKYINNHPFCLHLWKPAGLDILLPPGILVGFKNDGLETREERRQRIKDNE